MHREKREKTCLALFFSLALSFFLEAVRSMALVLGIGWSSRITGVDMCKVCTEAVHSVAL